MIGHSMSRRENPSANTLVDIWKKMLGMGPNHRNKRVLIFCLLAWLMIVLVTYVIVRISIGQVKRNISQSGIAMATGFSNEVSLPLLERDMAMLSRLLHEATDNPSVVYAAIIDHKNNIVAYTNAELIMPVNKGGFARTIDRVSFWEGFAADQKKIFSFSTNVTYAGTKIGEIYLALSAIEINHFKRRFSLITISSLGGLLLLAVLLHFSHLSLTAKRSRGQKSPLAAEEVPLGNMAHMACPLCGSHKPFTDEAVSRVNLDGFVFLRAANGEPGAARSSTSQGISLSEIGEREGLGWLKRQVIFRCTEIIRKLAA
jgi:uncharacterized membrane protein affecting hemolysin expression